MIIFRLKKCKKCFSLIIPVIAAIAVSCSSNGQKTEMQEKSSCFDTKLEALMSLRIYKDVMSQFIDTFKTLKDSTRLFGRGNVIVSKIDESIFFNKEKKECLLIVLLKPPSNIAFGEVRVVRGRYINGKWLFKPSMSFVYDQEYFKKYKENSFENISKLGRHSVLTEGEPIENGCEIDEEYWFKLMPTD
jgi:hypothetical protein